MSASESWTLLLEYMSLFMYKKHLVFVQIPRDVLFELHLKFLNIGIPARSLLKGRQTSN